MKNHFEITNHFRVVHFIEHDLSEKKNMDLWCADPLIFKPQQKQSPFLTYSDFDQGVQSTVL